MLKKEWGGIILQPSCLCRCVFCGPWPEVAEEEIKKQEQQVAKNLLEFKKRGIRYLEISGNDPIEYKKIISLVKYIRSLGFKEIMLSTHGRQLEDENFLDSLIAAGVTIFRIPIYGTNGQIHDAVTQSKGSFKETFRGLEYLKKRQSIVKTRISTLVMEQNKDNIISIIKLVRRLKFDDFYIAIPFFTSTADLSFYIPLKNLGKYIKPAYRYVKKNKFNIFFAEIPFCVFGEDSELIGNNSAPPDLGRHCQPPDVFRTAIKDLPSYRQKKQIKMCLQCQCRDKCDGFVLNDLDKFGSGKLKPVVNKPIYSSTFNKIIRDKSRIKSLTAGSSFLIDDFATWQNHRIIVAKAINSNGNILDIGCGNGFLLRCLQEWTGYKLIPYGIDINSESIIQARSLFKNKKDNFINLDFYRLEKLNRFKFPLKFNFIYWNICDHIMFESEKEQSILENIMKYVKPGGRMILGFYDSDNNKYKRLKIIESLGYKFNGRLVSNGKRNIVVWINKM